jgi:hypothetical protein
MVPKRVDRPVVVDSYYFDEQQDPDPYLNEKLDKDPDPDPH